MVTVPELADLDDVGTVTVPEVADLDEDRDGDRARARRQSAARQTPP
jgi:hypothetical protein